MHNFSCRFDKVGPGGRKCSCCNGFRGPFRKKLNRLVRRRLNDFFNKEHKAELYSKD